VPPRGRRHGLRSRIAFSAMASPNSNWLKLAGAGAVLPVMLAILGLAIVRTSPKASAAASTSQPSRAWSNEPDIQHLHFETAPIDIRPGQNTIQNVVIPQSEKPALDGYIVRMQPNLRYMDGTVPPVDIIHLHHGVWIDATRGPFFFAGEEKTVFNIPRGYGFPYKASDTWRLNQMIHNLTPVATRVRLVWDIDFIPAGTPLAATVKPVVPIWMDVRRGESYPVFNALRGSGARNGTYTYPTDAKNPYADQSPLNELRVPTNGTLVSAVGHLHPGGLRDDIDLVRPGATLPRSRACAVEALDIGDTRSASRCVSATAGSVPHSVRIFESDAHYFEPAGPVSWDVALTASRPDWRVAVRAGDTLRITTTYENRQRSWYENMGIVLLFFAPNDSSGVDPFTSAVDWRGVLTHGHLPENSHHGGAPTQSVDARRVASGPLVGEVRIKGFVYTPGDLNLIGQRSRRVPTVRQGHRLRFINQDNPLFEWHSITACADPCNRSPGSAYPLANAAATVQFDSGQLGYDHGRGRGSTPAANRLTWSTPANLKPGTYTYFCRVHPFMRGAFRVIRSIG
jgi:plastocyanin